MSRIEAQVRTSGRVLEPQCATSALAADYQVKTVAASALVLSTVHSALTAADAEEAQPGPSHERIDAEEAAAAPRADEENEPARV